MFAAAASTGCQVEHRMTIETANLDATAVCIIDVLCTVFRRQSMLLCHKETHRCTISKMLRRACRCASWTYLPQAVFSAPVSSLTPSKVFSMAM